MGISIHYRGKLRQASDLPGLVEEVEDIASILGWDYTTVRAVYPDHAFAFPPDNKEYGISIHPQDCEPVTLIFNSEGRLFSPSLKKMIDRDSSGEFKAISIRIDLNEEDLNPIVSNASYDEIESDLIYNVSIRTDFQDLQSHNKLVDLLRYLGNKYLDDFVLTDESSQVEMLDMDASRIKFDGADFVVQLLLSTLENKDLRSSEDLLKFIKEFRKLLRKNKK